MDKSLATSLVNFAARFCNENKNEKSSICSPLSAEVVLALTALASSGETRAELLKSMDLSDDEAIRSGFAFLTSTLKAVEGVTLRVANRVYVSKNGTLKPSIKKDAEEVFESGLEQLDFTEKAAAAHAVNNWVAEQTSNMIKDLVTPDVFNDDTALLLVNAIYFQGFWQSPFSNQLTRDRTFHVNNTTQIKVPMMFKSETRFYYKHSPELKAKLLRMSYEGRQASMVFVLPDEVEGLDAVLQQLAAGHDLLGDIAGLRNTTVDVMIPKFKIETEIDLMELLPKMGIKSIFDEKTSDIRMLKSERRQYVAKAVQKAVIEVDEAGTKAAASTYLTMRYCCSRPIVPRTEKFTADRPFLHMLMSQEIPIFIGVYEGVDFAVSDQK